MLNAPVAISDLCAGSYRPSSTICPSNQARSRFHTALSEDSFVKRSMIERPWRNASSAFAFSPAFLKALAGLAYDTGRSRLPASVDGIGLRQTGDDILLCLVRLQRCSEVTLRHLHVALRLLHAADIGVRRRQVALPSGVAGIGFRQPFKNPESSNFNEVLCE